MSGTGNSSLLGKITVIFVICFFALPAQAKYGGGTGEPNDPYLIFDANQMNAIGADSNDWDKHFILMADIDLSVFSGTDFNIIGSYGNPFTGVFDGSGHTISNFTYDSNDTDYIGLFGYVGKWGVNEEIKNLGLFDPNLDAGTGRNVGSLVGYLVNGTITNCYVQGGSVLGAFDVGGLVGHNWSTIDNCYSAGSVSGRTNVGGLVGWNNSGTITNCYSTSSVSGNNNVGGLMGIGGGTITNCYATASVSGKHLIGGLIGENYYGTISNCYATGSVAGTGSWVGGLVGVNWGVITNCYSAGSVSGNNNVGGLVGDKWQGEVTTSFWDIETSGQTTSDGGMGLPTAEMQMQVTFTDAGWDFTTPVWTIDEGVDYPRLWWELVPVLHAEPEITLGTSNTISWEAVADGIEYYAECAEDANFTSILYNTGWITETSCEFTNLHLGQRYWYSVKARNAAGVETDWSNVESSLQCTLADAVEIELEPESLKNENMKNALLNKIDAALKMIEEGNYTSALSKLEHDILAKTNGCSQMGQPDKNDWIISCEQQSEVYPLIIETIEYVKGLMGE
jgi:hypothetical protein